MKAREHEFPKISTYKESFTAALDLKYSSIIGHIRVSVLQLQRLFTRLMRLDSSDKGISVYSFMYMNMLYGH